MWSPSTGRVFLDDDGVGAVGDHAAGKNPHRFAGAYLARERAAGRDLADHLQPRGEIGGIRCAHRITVHRRHRLRRLRAPCGDVARQHAMKGGVERGHFLRQRLCACEDRGKGVGNRHQGHSESPALTSLRANGSRECAPDDRLREAIHRREESVDCFVRCAPRNDGFII